MPSLFSRILRSLGRTDLILGLVLALVLSSCKSTSTPKIDGIPGNLPSIPLYGSAHTPAHRMSRGDYPFDANGNYVTSWAAEGGSSAGPSDYQRSQQRDRDEPAVRRTSSTSTARKVASSPQKVYSSPPKKVASSSTGSSSAKKTSSSSSSGSTKHTVKSSDSLWSIAKKYGTTVAKIKSANGLKGDTIRDGTRLTIPR